MRKAWLVGVLLSGCGLYISSDPPPADPPPPSPAPAHDLYHLDVARSVAAEGEIRGVDADQHGGVWIAYATDPVGANPVVSLVHWAPGTRTRLATFTYADLQSPVSGLALVNGNLWLGYEAIEADAVTRVIDPQTGAIEATFGATGVELAAIGPDRVAISNDGVQIVDAVDGGQLAQFASKTVIDPGDMGGISFAGTQQGIAWRPGEIWLASWYMPLEVDDESGQLLGTIDLAAIRSQGAAPMTHLAFDHGQLLVGRGGELTWYDVH